jgi:hypothetical protein
VKLHPLSWNFSSCPPEEIPFLYCYEFSRELKPILETVDFIRRGQLERPSYWSQVSEFGWEQWPDRPYLWVPQAKRERRLARLLAASEEPVIVDLPVTATIADHIKALEVRVRMSERPWSSSSIMQRGRSASEAKYHDQLRMLTIYRLRQHHRPQKVCEILHSQYRKIAYTSSKNLSRSLRTFDRHLCAFYLRAQANIKGGLWFPPFGRHLIKP